MLRGRMVFLIRSATLFSCDRHRLSEMSSGQRGVVAGALLFYYLLNAYWLLGYLNVDFSQVEKRAYQELTLRLR